MITKNPLQTKNTQQRLEEVKQLKKLYYIGSRDAFTIATSDSTLEDRLTKIGNIISKKAHLKKSKYTFQPDFENLTRLHYPIFSALKSMNLEVLTEENIKIFDLLNVTTDNSFLSRIANLSFISDIFVPGRNNSTDDDILKVYGDHYTQVFEDMNRSNTNPLHGMFKTESNKKNQSVLAKIEKGITTVLNLLEENQDNNTKVLQILKNQPNFISRLKSLSKKINKKINSPENTSLSLIQVSELLKYNPQILSTLFFIGGYIAPNRQLYNQILGRDLENQDLMFKTLHKVNSFLNEVILGLVLSNYTIFAEVQENYKNETTNSVLSPMEVAIQIMTEGLHKKEEYAENIIKILLKKAKLKDKNINYAGVLENIIIEMRDTGGKLKIIDLIKLKKSSEASDILEPRTEEELIKRKKELYERFKALNLIYTLFVSKEDHIKSLLRE